MNTGKTSLILLIGSLVVTFLMWFSGFPLFFLFLCVPLLPFLCRKKSIRHCPACGWETSGNERYCPYDATPLEMRDPD
ncbi:hypothetical protein [Methanoregula sp.]|uniref:hypothetical protein n=1 Tax=Methanoregula sp. TaxID=2052170 RepID=UPI000CABCB30|nr:hypothetical protein [Methanoregula sp.]PKG33828.1 MAG: hypothetical protein CW742_00955 [Methanoregula sp.]